MSRRLLSPTRLAPVPAALAAALALACHAAAQTPAPAPPPPGPPPPANDARASAQPVTSLPAGVDGTTVGATAEPTEPGSLCPQPAKGSVWYELGSASDRRIVVNLAATGDLDANVEVFRRERSQVQPLVCDTSDANGKGAVTFQARKGESYLIRVAQLANSVAGTFRLDVFAPQPAPTAPGPALPRAGVTRTLDRVQNTADAWSASLHAGRSYRVNLAPRNHVCMQLGIYGPDPRSFTGAPVRTLRCGGYLLLTPGPGEGGRYSFRVTSRGFVRGPQTYHLQVAAAGSDDTAPGRFLPNFARAHGSLRGSGIDVVDLYRFDVVNRSTLFLSLHAADSNEFTLRLLDDGGRTLRSAYGRGAKELHKGLRPGRYFVAVQAGRGSRGRYVLRRASRTITKTTIAIAGARRAQSTPGTAVRISTHTSPSASGPVTITVQRFDPLSGWQFSRRFHMRAAGGVAGVSFTPPAVGRWRATASYDGTRQTAPSNTGYATLLVAGPLRQ